MLPGSWKLTRIGQPSITKSERPDGDPAKAEQVEP